MSDNAEVNHALRALFQEDAQPVGYERGLGLLSFIAGKRPLPSKKNRRVSLSPKGGFALLLFLDN